MCIRIGYLSILLAALPILGIHAAASAGEVLVEAQWTNGAGGTGMKRLDGNGVMTVKRCNGSSCVVVSKQWEPERVQHVREQIEQARAGQLVVDSARAGCQGATENIAADDGRVALLEQHGSERKVNETAAGRRIAMAFCQ